VSSLTYPHKRKLEVLKETKESAMIDLAADLDLVVHYDGGNGE